MSQYYTVRIRYREPSYPRIDGTKGDEPYRWTYELSALDSGDAEMRAVEEFHRIARLSSVGWVREIEGIDVTTAGGPPQLPPPPDQVGDAVDENVPATVAHAVDQDVPSAAGDTVDQDAHVSSTVGDSVRRSDPPRGFWGRLFGRARKAE